MSSAQFYKWRAKFGGMDASLMKRSKPPGNDTLFIAALVCEGAHASYR